MSNKEEKIREVLRELAAQYFSRESNRLSLITITGISLYSRGSRATILVTVMPETQEAAVIDFMTRKLSDFREYVSKNARMMRVPFFDVSIDKGEKNRQHIDDISRDIHH
jgi:ribosome-binding factor A